MGGHEGWAQPNGFFANGLLPNEAASVTRVLDPERWSRAEERTAELISCIQPNPPSEERRRAVAEYVRNLIMKCFSCQVFTFGSVPLKTYLPDGDIDLTAFSNDQNLKDTWATEVKDMLESEEKNEEAAFHVKEVQYIQAEVKIIKCLVENIVVDISFNQLGGLCTLCFLEEVDHLINQDHLFKRSIILIKAWCYYESRILGAHHGLISTYALETLVLYIFHVFNNSFAGPLEVLYRFLEFFSKFDWDNFCVGLWGPVAISKIPDMSAEPPRRDEGDLLLSKPFLDACSMVYAVYPGGQENQELPFISKHFNVIDPLRTNNNLGRSVNKGNFFRIRSAFAFGAQKLARLLNCPKENLTAEVNLFFMNTWERHGKGHRPDAPTPDLYNLGSSIDVSDILKNCSISNKVKENSMNHEPEAEVAHAANHQLKRASRTSNTAAVSRTPSQKTYADITSAMPSDHNNQAPYNTSSTETAYNDKGRNFRSEYSGNEVHARYLARTHSSPELSDTSNDTAAKGRRHSNRTAEAVKTQITSTRSDHSRRRNAGPDVSDNHTARFSNEDLDPPTPRQSLSHRSLDAGNDSNSVSNSYHAESSVSTVGEDLTPAETMQMHQDQQDLVNIMASSGIHGFGGQVQMPMIPPSILASWYGHRNSSGMPPTNFTPFETPWGQNMHFPPGMVPFPQYIQNMGMTSNQEEVGEAADDNSGTEIHQDDSDSSYWPERVPDSRRFDLDNGSSQVRQLEETHNFVPSARMSQHGLNKENKSLIREHYNDNLHYQNRGNDVYSSASSRLSPTSQATSSRTKASSDGSWDGSSSRVSKSPRERRGRKNALASDTSNAYGLGKNAWKYDGESVDHASSQADDDNRDWTSVSTNPTEGVADRAIPVNIARGLQIPGYEPPQISGSNSMLPMGPMIVGSGARQVTFYPTGPPVPFLTMLPLPIYNFQNEAGNSGASTSHFDREEELSGVSPSGQSLESHQEFDQSEALNSSNHAKATSSVDPSEERKADILNSDFASHWQNLQYGRFCQSARYSSPIVHPSSMVVPPGYLHGHFPWDGPGRPVSANMNAFAQLVSYSPRMIPVPPLQPASNRPTGVYQQFGDEIPRYRGGTGTYLPNPKISYKDRQSSNNRSHRGNYSFDRKDHHGDREGNWNTNSKPRYVSRGQGRNQVDKPNTRLDRSTSSNNRYERPWDSYKHEAFPSYHSQNGPFSTSNSTHRGSANVAYGMHPGVNPNGVSPSGTVPQVVMVYPYDQNLGYAAAPADQLEFGSLGPMHFSGVNEIPSVGEGSSRGVNEQRSFRGDSSHSSPDRPSSPNLQRGG